jgi:hypothetical protein
LVRQSTTLGSTDSLRYAASAPKGAAAHITIAISTAKLATAVDRTDIACFLLVGVDRVICGLRSW